MEAKLKIPNVFQKSQSIEQALVGINVLVFSLLVMLFAVGLGLTSHWVVENFFKERLAITQKLFTQTIHQDLIMGANHEVYRKCKIFFNEPGIQAITVSTLNNNDVCSFSNETGRTLNLRSAIYFDEQQKTVAGYVSTSYSLESLYSLYGRLALGAFFLFIGFVVLQISLLRKTGKKVTEPVKILAERLKTDNIEDFARTLPPTNVTELDVLQNGLQKLSIRVMQAQRDNILRAEAATAIELARQVSHDIRSPLSALTLLMGNLAEVSEDKRILVRTAVSRINDIANTLLNRGRTSHAQSLAVSDRSKSNKPNEEPTLLASLIEYLSTEKRVQYRDYHAIAIETDVDNAYGLFARVSSVELKRAISNLIDNAVEASLNRTFGKVTVSVQSDAGYCSIIVQDNGCGIPREIQDKVGIKGFSHGKGNGISGSGLGLHHAQKMAEEAGGSLKLESEEGRGTTVQLIFPLASPPMWFVEALTLRPKQRVIALDDDLSVHQVWRDRLESGERKIWEVQLQTMTSANQLRDFCATLKKETSAELEKPLYLLDYELVGQAVTGLDLIEELGIASDSILVTSRYDEEEIQLRCERLGVKLIPKPMAGFVPIRLAMA